MALTPPKLPTGYTTLTFSIPAITGGSAFASAVIQSISLDGAPEFITTTGNDGLVCGVQPLMANAVGAGGTKHDADSLSINVLPGNLTAGWPAEGSIVTIAGMPVPFDGLNTKWMVTGKTLGATQKANGTMTFKLQRWCNVAL